jgi:hypothetical protein
LRQIWERGHASDDSPRSVAIARQAFWKACAVAEDSADEILAAARVWRAACDAPRFLPRLADWLAAEGWTKPPPAKGRARGGRAHDGLPRTNGRKVNVTKVGLLLGGYVENPDGSLFHPDGAVGSDFDWERSL